MSEKNQEIRVSKEDIIKNLQLTFYDEDGGYSDSFTNFVEKHVEKKREVEIPEGWKPKTVLGKKVLAGEITDIDEVFASGVKIAEPPIVDILLPDLEKDVIFVGGSTGKGGGIRRTPFRRT